jgi:CRP/FNR family cyclic AMP-dependent transcriptional regulator
VTISIPLFQGLPQKILDQLLSSGVQRTYPRNSVILNEGDEATSLYIGLSGRPGDSERCSRSARNPGET